MLRLSCALNELITWVFEISSLTARYKEQLGRVKTDSPDSPESHSSSAKISLIKIDSIESAHKLSYQPEFGKLCLIGKRSRQFLSIDINQLLSKPLIEQQQQQDDIDYDQDDDYPRINVKIEHIQNIDRCHLFESYLSQNGYWYLAVATPETIFVLLFNKTTSKYTLVKTINTQADSPCLCLKFSVLTNQLIYGCSKVGYCLTKHKFINIGKH